MRAFSGFVVFGVIALTIAFSVSGQAGVYTPLSNNRPIPSVPKVFGAELEFNIYNGTNRENGGSRTIAIYDLVDQNRKLSKATFRIENERAKSTMDEIVISDYTQGVNWIVFEGRCRKRQPPPADELERFTLQEIIFLSEQPEVKYAGQDMIRGIEADYWEATDLPIDKGIIKGILKVRWYFSRAEWDMWGTATGSQQLLEVRMEGFISGGNYSNVNLQMSVVDISPSRAYADDLFVLPSECDEGPTTGGGNNNGTDAPPPLDLINPMPKLPSRWSAVIETSMKETKETFTTYQYLDSGKGMAHTAWVKPTLDEYDRQRRHDIYIVGAFQLAYEATQYSVPKGYDSLFNSNERKMFFPDTYRCSKNVFTQDLVGSTEDVLLQSAASRARYMGTTSVRGITAKYWQSSADGFPTVQWYFADTKWPYSSTNTSVLLRMTIEGSSRSPFFVHHPFYQTSASVPSTMLEACSLFYDGALNHCDQDVAYYKHVHEFFSFTDVVVDSDFDLPSFCRESDSSSINSVPGAENCERGWDQTSVLLMLLLSAIFTIILTSLYWNVKLNRRLEELKKQVDAANSGSTAEMTRSEH